MLQRDAKFSLVLIQERNTKRFSWNVNTKRGILLTITMLNKVKSFNSKNIEIKINISFFKTKTKAVPWNYYLQLSQCD